MLLAGPARTLGNDPHLVDRALAHPYDIERA
jgi:hypothetical protein